MLTNTHFTRFALALAPLCGALALAAQTTPESKTGAFTRTDIKVVNDQVEITAGPLVRILELKGNRIRTARMQVDGAQLSSGPSREFQVAFYEAEPNQRPVGLKPGDTQTLHFESIIQDWQRSRARTNAKDVKMAVPMNELQPVQWKNAMLIDGERMAESFRLMPPAVTKPREGVTRLNLRGRVIDKNHLLHHVAIDLFYEVYEGYPVIRKWVEIANNGPRWLKIDKLTIDALELAPGFRFSEPLTPQENGAGPSVIGFGDERFSRGIIAASEIPSALRNIGAGGAMGYSEEYFEWVLGPSERFVSEPVFHFGYAGKVDTTASAVSTPMARAVEGLYMRFLERVVGVRGLACELPAPVWCSWANFKTGVDDANMREQADIAARAGFKTFLIDDGWSIPALGNTEPVLDKFPDFVETSQYIRSRGLRLGLWISCIRHAESQDLAALPGATTTPPVERRGGYGMSFTSPWRDYFANDLVYMHDHLGATYVKEDFSQILFGDITEGHEARTRKESILRGLRGLLRANDQAAHRAPGLFNQITHEIYWATPGVACDIAALKSCASYHIPPNIHLGNPNSNLRVAKVGTADPLKLRQGLIDGCWMARQRYFDHRGLPLYPLEYYSAGSVNFKGSLTPQVQDRQVCSWLMSSLSVFAGDLASLTEENIRHYRQRFELVKRLQDTYDIYHHFQFSGVPQPTDTDWHWWGKLNEQGCGVVVVLRGSAGAESRAVNIPWAHAKRKYQVRALLADKKLGKFSGAQLQKGALNLALPAYGQEILELAAAE